MALALAGAAGVRKSGANPCPFDEDMLEYYRDLLAQFAVPYDEQRLREGPNVSYTELADALLSALGPEAAAPDVILLTYAVPDLHPLRVVSAHVNARLGGGANSMALSEQGLRSPYTALQVADAFHRAGRCDTAVLLVLEQTSLPYHDPLVHDTPLTETAAALVLRSAPGPVAGPPWTGTPAELAALLADTDPDTVVIAGPWVAAGTASRMVRCATGTYCTSVWLALAEKPDLWRDNNSGILLCDVDPRTGRAHAVRLDPARTLGEARR
ncbi:hypothetical protein ACQPW3_25320 [Actinosynnema sp. CA-248983]